MAEPSRKNEHKENASDLSDTLDTVQIKNLDSWLDPSNDHAASIRLTATSRPHPNSLQISKFQDQSAKTSHNNTNIHASLSPSGNNSQRQMTNGDMGDTEEQKIPRVFNNFITQANKRLSNASSLSYSPIDGVNMINGNYLEEKENHAIFIQNHKENTTNNSNGRAKRFSLSKKNDYPTSKNDLDFVEGQETFEDNRIPRNTPERAVGKQMVGAAAVAHHINSGSENSHDPDDYSNPSRSSRNMRGEGEILTEKKQFLDENLVDALHTNSDAGYDDKEIANRSLTSPVKSPAKKKPDPITPSKDIYLEKRIFAADPNNVETEDMMQARIKLKSRRTSFGKLDDPSNNVTTHEGDINEFDGSRSLKALEHLTDVRLIPDSATTQKDTNSALSRKSEGKKKKAAASRFNPGFFKTHIQNRTGIPTLTAKKRDTIDIYNLDKLGIATQRADSNAKINSRRNSVVSFSDTEIRKTPLKAKNKLMEAFENIQMHRLFKQKIEMFILFFNQDAERGISFLIENELIDNSPLTIARIFLTTEGLNKEMIGKYLGSHKERNLKVLKAYCHSLDFSGLEFDRALRLLLSRFKLPGEAQQIERIVEIFAKVFHSDNPTIFVDEDTPFILAYSLLMLNTDAHSEKIPKNKKMTKQQFIQNNMRVCKNIPAEYLGKMFDNITSEKFETKTDYIEQIYNRLQMDNKKTTIQGETLKQILLNTKDLMTGHLFKKYGRRGKPHERYVWISEKEDEVFWKNPKKPNATVKSIPMYEIKNIHVGSNSTEVLRRNKVPTEFDNIIFSIEAEGRTLDLQAPNPQTRIKWEEYFRLLLIQRKERDTERLLKMKDRRSKDRERISEIWKTDILPNFHQHWDYETHRPKGMEELRAKKPKMTTSSTVKRPSKTKPKKKGFLNSILNCGNESESPPQNRASLGTNPIVLEDADSDEEAIKNMCKNKSLLLYQVWRLGIPDWLRKTIWPITIGNRLEITPTLYNILLSQARGYLRESRMQNANTTASLKALEKDLPETFPNLDFFKSKEHSQSLVNILEAFIFYRPDVGYVKGMSNVAAILLLFCPEYEAFACFINLTHSHHFISCFRGDMREIEWRLQFFNSYFKKELPQLYNHFRALDLSSEIFLLDWFLALFSTAFSDVDIIARIWDCFLLDGEVFAITTTLAILKYYELELKMMTFDGAVKFLKKLPDILNEKEFFNTIEELRVPYSEYRMALEEQSVAQINTQIHQALLF